MAIGTRDWVRSISKGVWQVVRQVPEYYEPRCSLREPRTLMDGPIFIVKRIVNDKWKPALAMESIHATLLRPLNKADARKLDKLLQDNAKLSADFQAFAKPIQPLLNLSFSLKNKSDYRPFKEYFTGAFVEALARGLSSDAILKLIAKSPYAAGLGQIPRQATLQFVCEDYEVKRRHLIFRQLNVHHF